MTHRTIRSAPVAALAALVVTAALVTTVTVATVPASATARHTGAAPLVAGPCGKTTVVPAYKHVIWVWMENHSYTTIIG